MPLGDVRALVVDEAHLVLGQGASRRRRSAGAAAVAVRGHRAPVLLEGGARDPVDARRAAHGREAQADRALGQPVDRHHRLAAEAVGREALHEPVDRLRAHRLRAVEGHAPRREVEPFQRVVGDLAHAQLEGEVRRGGEGGPALVDRPQPALRARQERERALQGERDAVVQAEEPRPDEAHVVVQGQPARADVGRPHVEAEADGADVREQVVVGEEDALGRARAARRVLDERGIRPRALRLRARRRRAR